MPDVLVVAAEFFLTAGQKCFTGHNDHHLLWSFITSIFEQESSDSLLLGNPTRMKLKSCGETQREEGCQKILI